jgi:hypothetical protein
MRKHFFRRFIADPVCASSGPGHHVDVGRYFMAVVKSSVSIPVQAAVDDDGFVHLDWDGQSANCGTTAPTMSTTRCAAPTASPSGHRNGRCFSCRKRR